MIFGYTILATALLLSLTAAYYSIMGLTAIFAAAAIPVIIMGGSLELGKIVATVWLHNNWQRASWLFKTYLVPAIVFLMLLTSMGIFGYLSKAHLDQNIPSGDAQSKVAIYDEKIKTAKDNIEANRKALKQMDESVDQLMARTTDDTGAQRAANMRRSQAKERGTLQADIQKNQTDVAKFNEERAPLAAEFRKIEAEVGPIKYIAALLYGDNPDQNILEKAVRFVIIMIVLVFDPLALCLILAANKQFEWARQGKGGWIHDKDGTIVGVTPGTKINDDEAAMNISAEDIPGVITRPFTQAEIDALDKPIEDEAITVDKYAKNNPPIDENIISTATPIAAPPVPLVTEPPVEPQFEGIRTPGSTEWVQTGPVFDAPNPRAAEASPGRNRGIMYSQPVQADNTPLLGKASNSDFGNQYPDNPEKGDVYLRTDFLPNRLFKYNGNKWIEVDKNQTDVYAYEEQYIKYLIEQIEQGKYDAETLTAVEREQIAQYIGKNA